MAEQRTRRPQRRPMGDPGQRNDAGRKAKRFQKTLSKNWFVISEDTGMQSLPL